MSLDLKNYIPAVASLGISIMADAGVPSMTASKGSLYINTTGSSSSTRMYVNTDGATTWTAVTTAA
jgi:hypothetical protein